MEGPGSKPVLSLHLENLGRLILVSIFFYLGHLLLLLLLLPSFPLKSDKSVIVKMSNGAQAFDLGPAGKVSPLIKTARWGLLLAGIWWGHRR